MAPPRHGAALGTMACARWRAAGAPRGMMRARAPRSGPQIMIKAAGEPHRPPQGAGPPALYHPPPPSRSPASVGAAASAARAPQPCARPAPGARPFSRR
jgi:hypothetical protein